MAVVLYTTTDSIRAAIGLTLAELADQTIINLNVEDQLLVYLNQVCPTHADIAAAGQAPSPSDDDKNKYRCLRLIAMYECGVICLQNAQYLLAQTMQDGGTMVSRFAKDDLTTTLNNILSQRDYYLNILNGELGNTNTGALFTVFSTVQPSYDPVRGR